MGNDDVKPIAGYEAYDCENWDGYGAKPITPETLALARRLLELMPDTAGWPHIAPGGDGSIGFEWSLDRRVVCFDVNPDQSWHAFWKWPDGRFEHVEGAGSDATEAVMLDLFRKFERAS